MKQGSNQGNASIAWFKLAELITRREREKALNVYRLLAHSFERKAYALQLEGDILWSLDDKAALEKYRQAAFLYHKEKQWVDAAGICEHLYTMNPHDVEILSHLIRYYTLLEWPERFSVRINDFVLLVEKKIAQEHQFVTAIKNIVEDISDQGESLVRTWLSAHLQEVMPRLTSESIDQLNFILE